MPEDTTRCTCERCQLKDSTNQLRPSDEVLCDKCYQKERKQADEININETSTDIQDDEKTEDQNGYVVNEKDEDEDCMPACTFVTAHWLNPEAEEFTSVIIKNSSGVDVCSKCRKKLVNGIRCTTCKNPWHWGCSGMSKDAGHDQLCNWECITCTGTDINCQSCKLKDKGVQNLKKNISELELKLQELNKARKTNNERITDLEDRLDMEKKLRKRVERDLICLQETDTESTSSSSSDSEDDSEYDCSTGSRSREKRKTKPDVKTQSKKKLVTISVMKNLKDNLLKEINSVQKAPKRMGLNRVMLLKS